MALVFNPELGMDVHKEAASAGTSDPVILHGRYEEVSVGVNPGGTATIEYTLNPYADLATPASCTWYAWSAGAVGVPTADNFDGPVTAVRIVTPEDPATWFIVARPAP